MPPLTPQPVFGGLTLRDQKTCQQVNYLICPQGHAFLLNHCVARPRRCLGDRILQGHIGHIMAANGKLVDIINWEGCCVSEGPASSELQVSFYRPRGFANTLFLFILFFASSVDAMTCMKLSSWRATR